MINKFSAIDLFCGIGGVTHGFKNEGIDVVCGIDSDLSCKYAYEKNNNSKFLHRDIGDMSSEELKSIYPEGKKKILIGCAPCQPFSILNRKKEENKKDSRWRLLYNFASLIKKIKPEIISMENVPSLKSFQDGNVFNDFVTMLENEGYFISSSIINAQDYGVPQRRRRLVLLGSLKNNIEMIPPTHKDNVVTVEKAIGHLPAINHGETSLEDEVHCSKKLSELNLKRIKATPEGGGWKDWSEDLVSDCHKKESGKGFGSAYGRMSWDEVAPTLTTYCSGYSNGRFGHPEQDRPISIREAALIQSFPIDYKFISPNQEKSFAVLARQIGNAVPVLLSQAIGRSIIKHVDENYR